MDQPNYNANNRWTIHRHHHVPLLFLRFCVRVCGFPIYLQVGIVSRRVSVLVCWSLSWFSSLSSLPVYWSVGSAFVYWCCVCFCYLFVPRDHVQIEHEPAQPHTTHPTSRYAVSLCTWTQRVGVDYFGTGCSCGELQLACE